MIDVPCNAQGILSALSLIDVLQFCVQECSDEIDALGWSSVSIQSFFPKIISPLQDDPHVHSLSKFSSQLKILAYQHLQQRLLMSQSFCGAQLSSRIIALPKMH